MENVPALLSVPLKVRQQTPKFFVNCQVLHKHKTLGNFSVLKGSCYEQMRTDNLGPDGEQVLRTSKCTGQLKYSWGPRQRNKKEHGVGKRPGQRWPAGLA